MSEMSNLLKDIKANLSQKSASQKDEVRVMQVMLNDKEYAPTVYNSDGSVAGTYCPAQDARDMIGSVISSTAKINKNEAAELAAAHTFTKSEASSFVGVSKEFVNSYMQTGRKLPFGGRERSNIAITGQDLDQTTKRYPKKVGVKEDGTGIYENAEKIVPAHLSAKVSAPCPEWVK